MVIQGTVGPESIVEVILREGQSLRLRPIRPDDRQRWLDFAYSLSPRTRYLRFQYAKNYFSDEEVTYYTQVTPPERCAYVATAGEGSDERIVAIGRYDLLPDGKTAEVGFSVEDRVQLRGIGTALLEQLAATAPKYRLKAFLARVLPENSAMLEVFDDSGFKTTRTLEEGVWHITIDLEEQEEFEKRQAYREHVARSAGVRRLLRPKSVAVIGASRDPDAVGGAVFRNLLYGGVNATVFPVNPSAPSVCGVLAYPTILDVPADVDLGVIIVPAEFVPAVIDQCGKKGVPALVIISAGFGEAGERGKELEQVVRQKVLSYGMRVVGPNCLGIMNMEADVNLNATFAPTVPPRGNVSIGTQSGALGLALLDHAKHINLGLAHFLSIGNRIDISSNDLLEFWEDDPNTDVILIYAESLGNPQKFSRVARRVSKQKPIIAVKAGKSAVGARAASSHTGALAGADVAADAMLRQTGVIRVNTIEEMFNVAELLAYQPAPKGRRVGILTNAGGPGVMAADACDGWGLAVPAFSAEIQSRLREFLPANAAVANPVDMIASAPPEHYKKALAVLLDAEEIDSIVVIYIPPLVTEPQDVAAAIREVTADYEGDKTVLASFMMSGDVDLRTHMRRFIPSFTFPEDAIQALARACQYSEFRKQEQGVLPRFPDIDTDAIRSNVLSAVELGEIGTWLPPETAAELLKAYGLPAAETKVAMSADEAARLADGLGFPVVMKVRSRTIVHKTDVGGIIVGLKSEEEVRNAFADMSARIEKAGLANQMEGVILQPMAPSGQEVIVGMSKDPEFGALVMVGLGGVQVELIKDVSFSLQPVTDLDADRMLHQLKGFPLLDGWRGAPRRDVAALKDTILRFSKLIEDFPEIDQMEMNPVLVYDESEGCTTVDVRALMKAAPAA